MSYFKDCFEGKVIISICVANRKVMLVQLPMLSKCNLEIQNANNDLLQSNSKQFIRLGKISFVHNWMVRAKLASIFISLDLD